jgi:hypothetical protein
VEGALQDVKPSVLMEPSGEIGGLLDRGERSREDDRHAVVGEHSQ